MKKSNTLSRSARFWNLCRPASAIACMLFAITPVMADEFNDDDDKPRARGTVVSSEAMSMGSKNAWALAMRADEAAKDGNLEKSIKLYHQAIDEGGDDMEMHVGYAKVLERKLHAQNPKDPALFSETVEEWLNVFRSKWGDEAGMTAHGLSIGNINALYGDEDRQRLAKVHLKKIAGDCPKAWETNARFLKRVLAKNVQGNLVKTEDSAPVADKDASSEKKSEQEASRPNKSTQ